MTKIIASLLGITLGITLAASGPAPAQALPIPKPKNQCQLIAHCLFVDGNYCHLSPAQISEAEDYYRKYCGRPD
jgi:hypothetical protein